MQMIFSYLCREEKYPALSKVPDDAAQKFCLKSKGLFWPQEDSSHSKFCKHMQLYMSEIPSMYMKYTSPTTHT